MSRTGQEEQIIYALPQAEAGKKVGGNLPRDGRDVSPAFYG
jgi:hypothetical protein